MQIDQQIIHFLNEHHLLTLATSQNNKPYCCNLFYVYDQVSNQLIFSTETKTKHAQDFITNTNVAGSITSTCKESSILFILNPKYPDHYYYKYYCVKNHIIILFTL